MSYHTFTITHPHSRLSFNTRPERKGDRPWWRYLDLDGQPLYVIGNICDTCLTVFGIMEYVPSQLTADAVAEQLRAGLQEIPRSLIDSIAQILPKGAYVASLLRLKPALMPPDQRPYGQQKHFCWHQSVSMENDQELREFILPIVDYEAFDAQTIAEYKERLKQAECPTALALSVVDVRYPSGRGFHWSLNHILLDGHHKIMAASQLGVSINLLSFLNINQSFARKELIDAVVQQRYASGTA